ncbi:MAG: PAS domain S-box protein [Bacillota bacterium]
MGVKITDEGKTKEELIKELVELRRQNASAKERTKKLIMMNKRLEREIIELKRSGQTLRESEERYRRLAENTFDIICEVSNDGRYLYLSPNYRDVLGYDPSELLGRSIFEFIHSDDIPVAMSEIKKAIEDFGSGRATYRFLNRKGEWSWFESIGKPYEIATGEIRGVIISRDITERKHAEDALRSSEIKYKKLANLLPVTILEMDERGFLTFANLNAFKTFGATKGDFERGICLLDFIIPEDRDRAKENINRVLNGEYLDGIEYTAQRKNGSTFPIILYSSAIVHENKPVGLRGVIIDITERKQAKLELEKSYESLQHILKETVNALAMVAGKRDPYTAGHQQRVAELACAIAREMGLPEEQIEGIYVAGILHDIGKIYIPTDILNKPGRLSDIEMSLTKTHPQVGYEIVKTIPFKWPVDLAVLQHHERIDGSGYPSGLTGENILIEAKILAVADVVEAIASHRPYRPALGIEKALDEIKQNRDILYDPNVVDACLKLFSEGGIKIFDNNKQVGFLSAQRSMPGDNRVENFTRLKISP